MDLREDSSKQDEADKEKAKEPNPLTYSLPSPMMLVNFPLFATNVRILCQKDGWKAPPGQSSLVTTIASLRLTYRTEGLRGLYRGGHLYLLHQVAREGLRCCAAQSWVVLEKMLRRRWRRKRDALANAASSQDAEVEKLASRWLYWRRMATKYAIDVFCYPVLLASTRAIVLSIEPAETWQRLCMWSREEGALSLFNGLTCSLVSTALDEAMELFLAGCIEQFSAGTEIELADKLLLKASALSVVSIFTAPFNYVGTIQRCQSSLPGLLSFSPLIKTVKSLPWSGSVYQFFLFAGIFTLNVKMIQWKLTQAQPGDDEDLEAE